MKKPQPKIKQIKTGKEIVTTSILVCKDFIHNFEPQEVKMINKVLREKSNCIVCGSENSRFLKQKHNNENKISQVKNVHIYCENCKNHTGNTFPKNLFLILKNKIKGKSKCVICLTE